MFCCLTPLGGGLVDAFITAHLNDYNSIIVAISNCSIQKLQLIQNSAARLVLKADWYHHITFVLKHLHWFPVRPKLDLRSLSLFIKPFINYPMFVISWDHISQQKMRSVLSNLLVSLVTFETSCRQSFHYISRRIMESTPRLTQILSHLTNSLNPILTFILFNVAYSYSYIGDVFKPFIFESFSVKHPIIIYLNVVLYKSHIIIIISYRSSGGGSSSSSSITIIIYVIWYSFAQFCV